MDPAHALLQTGRIPRNIVVDHDPAKLEVNAFGRSIGADHEPRTAITDRLSKPVDLILAFGIVHATVNGGYLVGMAHAVEPSHEKIQCVAVFGENDKLFSREPGIGNNLMEFVEF